MNSTNHESNHHRRSIRLPGYDYSQPGAYFITICTHNRECLFGEIANGEMRLNESGQIVLEEWYRSALIRAEIELDEFVIMPNHIHGIVIIREHVEADGNIVGAYGHTMGISDLTVGASGRTPLHSTHKRLAPVGPAPKSIGALIAGFKSAVTRRINIIRQTPRMPVWQRNYWEHIIRDEISYQQITDYILTNPQNWEKDQLFTRGNP